MLHPNHKTIIFNFHGIGEPATDAAEEDLVYWASASLFEQVLNEVKTRPWVRLTFDDSLKSDVEIALPLLQREGLTAEFFVSAGKLNQPGYLTTEDVRTLVTAGMTIGSHGMDHRAWTTFRPDALRTELSEARKTIADLSGRPVRTAACPFGAYNRAVLAALRAHGFETVYTSDGGWADNRAWLQPRNTVQSNHTADHVATVADYGWPLRERAAQCAKRLYKRIR